MADKRLNREPRRRSGGKAVHRLLGAMAWPVRLMAATWLLFGLFFVFGPLEFYRDVSAHTWAVVLMGGGIFALGAHAARIIPVVRSQTLAATRVDAVITITAVVGLGGVLFLALDKVLLSGLDYSQGLAEVRFRRDAEVAAGIDIPRSVFLYIGYATFSFGFCATVLFVLVAEEVRRVPAALAQISIASPVVYALLYGGRAPILLLCLLVLAAGLVRVLLGKPFLPRAYRIRAKFVLLCLALFLYVNYTWEDRRQYSGIESYPSFLEVAHERWGLRPRPWVHDAVLDGTLPARTTMDLLNSSVYVTHSITTLDRMIEHRGRFSPYLGTYQIGILSPLIRVLAPTSSVVDRMTQDLQESGTFGWFPTAWGAWFMDLGATGAVLAVFLWGLLSGAAYRTVRRAGGQGAQLLLAFALGSVMVSPLNAPFGLANSFLIFCSFVITATLMPLRAAQGPRSNRAIATTAPGAS